ncbi:hypothetical protein QCA50_010973 [Cerrena zonata]|uniref:Uncharacterized protein n=1 Tax=Cerrena zonata TaxID=2478898 RepID=A0AAW0G5R0_9APHY
MHRCLFINEILEGIAWDLSLAVYSADHNIEESSSRPVLPDKKSLLAFILTCRAFCEPGLNVLWHSLDGIYPLACTFQSNVTLKIEKAPDGSRETVTGFTRIPKPHDWSRFNLYATRVRSLVQTHTNPRNVDSRFLAEISLYRQTTNLLPNLRSLSWRDRRAEYFPYISLFTGASLKGIDTYISTEDMFIAFWDLLHNAPAVDKVLISVAHFELSPLALGSQIRALSSLKHLKELRSFNLTTGSGLPELSAETLTCLSHIPTLETLKCRLRRGPIPDQLQAVGVLYCRDHLFTRCDQ